MYVPQAKASDGPVHRLMKRRLYEYALRAVCSSLRVIEPRIASDQLAAHVAKLFNVDRDEHDRKYMRSIRTQSCPVLLVVDVKKARDLPGEDQNGLSDPYCRVSVVYNPINPDDCNGSTLSETPPESPSQMRRTASLFSCASAPSTKNKLKPSRSSIFSRKNSSRKRSMNRLQRPSIDRRRASSTIIYTTKIQEKTINPEWNEHFEFEIDDITQQCLLITVFDSDHNQIPGMKTVVQEKRGISRTIRGIQTFFTTGQIEDDFLGQITLDIKSLATFNGEQWFPLGGSNQNRSNNSKSRGEILLGLKVHFKLHEHINWLTQTLNARSSTNHEDERKPKDRQRMANGSVLEFRRRHSSLVSNVQMNSSIILRPVIFRANFRPSSLQVRDYKKTNIFEGDYQTQISQNESCLTPATDSDSPLLIEEYHQLFRIIMLHELEDTRETHKDQTNGLVIDWTGSLNELSYNVLVQFRVLYNIPVLSESFIQLLVIMELRCSEDYALFISQAVIEAYLKLFMDNVRQRSDINDLDFTDYEKTVFKEIFYLFIGHYKQRVHTDTLWFIPSKENLPNIQSIFDTIFALLHLKICSNESLIKNHLEETIKARLLTDINDSFSVNSFVFNDINDIQLNKVRDFLNYVTKLTESMSFIREYQKIFALFNVSYIKICFFETNSAADRLSELIKCLLANMTEYFQTYSKPMVKATSSIYDPNVIQSSSVILTLYMYIQTIVSSIRDNFEKRDWQTKAFKLKLNHYHEWFSPTMKYLLEGFVAHIRQAMERAVEDDYEIVPDEDSILPSQSSKAATSLCIKLCQEWELLDYPDIDIRYTALIKLTNTICEQCQHYARRTARKLSENGYFTQLDRTRSFNVSKKLCMLVNDIEYVKFNILSSLPTLLNFSGVLNKMLEKYEFDDFQQTKITLERLISGAEHEMNDVIRLIFEHVAALVHASLQNKISNYYRDEKRGKVNCIEDVNRYIDKEILEHLYEGLERVQYSRVACAIRIKVLQCLRELLPSQEPPEFFERVLQSFDQLAAYFDIVCRENGDIPGPPCDEIKTFRRTLQTCALTTEQLQLSYFREICQIHSPHEYQGNNGEIVFRAAYELVSGLITIHVFILCCRNLPKMDLIGTSDPYVVLELLPYSLYNKPLKEQKTSVKKRTLNPEYKEPFQWHRLPTNVLQERGAVLRLSVWDADTYKTDDFIGEYFVPLTNIQSLNNLASLRDVPVTEVRLRTPYKSMQPRAFELIRNRAAFDKQAADFVKQRTAVMQSGTGSDGASVKSDDRSSSGSYTSSALRSLLCMLPFNLGFDSDTTVHDRLDVGDSEELI